METAAEIKLKKFVPNPRKFASRRQHRPRPIVHDGHVKFIVNKILDHRFKHRTLQFLVDWEGYGPDARTWEPTKHVAGCDQLQDYLNDHPELLTAVGPVQPS
ncbi:hypothetical protein PTSG_12469 [Salpingoeca rosetta]|uniref:Chromo domain-containing protein n=1 Tax=Salpingoeca rosetta (strain ATCC 50818 / BSB-021) TaxID=946362 RepID=F2UFQ7_SALR5|nr:uncharacterized protein PTSG_12469 [Salpingoeca rosetta]EGD75625.1 hypothetical protein PTSG_12469 [Salpingoeca rosetta]|eukprot:XP_004992082.1 hypothetical protein PTSG_12469 [Salpingoeca rosetta]